MIKLQDVALSLGTPEDPSGVRFHLPAFEVTKGEALALTGPSGCGKSTLLNLIAGLRQADQGQITVNGTDLGTLSPAQLDRFRGTQCGMIFQSFHLLAPFSAVENVMIGLRFGARSRSDPKQRAREVLERVGLSERLHARPDQLSVGERQRVAIARAVAGGAPILLADEPTGSLDPETGRKIFALLRDLATEDGRTLLMVTHDPSLAEQLPRRIDCNGLVQTTSSAAKEVSIP